MANTYEFKIVLVGDSGVGKSWLSHWFAYQTSCFGDIGSTVGAAFMTRAVYIDENKVTFQLWDTAGQERFRSLVKLYFTGAAGCLCVCDLTNRDSYDNLDYWFNECLNNTSLYNIKYIVANKCDIPPEKWMIFESDLKKISEKHNVKYFITSSVTGQNVNEVFEQLGRDMIDEINLRPRIHDNERRRGLILRDSDNDKPKNSVCNCITY